MRKFNFKKLFTELSKNKFTICVCVIFSFVLWVFTIMFNSNSDKIITIYGVPVSSNISNTQAEQLGLCVVDFTPKVVDVQIKGPRHKIAFIKKDDILITPKTYGNIVSSGSYNLELNASLKKFQQNVTVENISNKNVIFVIDSLETKLINLSCDDLPVKISDGYFKDETVCQPKSLYVNGPKQSIEKLEKIKLVVEGGPYELKSSKVFDAVPKFIANDGSVMDSSIFKYNKDIKFNVTVPVYRVKKVPFKILYKNAPEGLDVNLLKPVIEPNEIEIGGSDEQIEKTNEVNLGYVDLRELSEQKTNFSFNLTLPSGLKDVSQIASVNVNFDKSKLDYRIFDVRGVELLNVPQGFEIFTNCKIIKDVKIVGLKGYLKDVDVNNLTATVDCSAIDLSNLKNGMQNVAVDIGVIKKNGVWPIGKYKCSITIKKR